MVQIKRNILNIGGLGLQAPGSFYQKVIPTGFWWNGAFDVQLVFCNEKTGFYTVAIVSSFDYAT
jgi:hypothetical protein